MGASCSPDDFIFVGLEDKASLPIMSKISGNFSSRLQELRGAIGHGKICGADLKIGISKFKN